MTGLRSIVAAAMATASLATGCAVTDASASGTLLGTWKRVGGELRCQQYLPTGVFKQWWRTGEGDGARYQAGMWQVNDGRIEIEVLDGDGIAPRSSVFMTLESLSYGSMAVRGDDGANATYERVSLTVDGPCAP